jgi:AraC-like DNA-binding protein
MSVILIIGFSQAFILSALILTKKPLNISDKVLSGLFAMYGLTLFLGYMEVYNRQNDYPFPFLVHSAVPFILLHGPFLWYYIKTLTTQNFSFRPMYFLHLLPFFGVVFFMAIDVYSLSSEEKILVESAEAFKDELAFPVIIGLIAASTIGYFIWGLALIAKFRKQIKGYFSEISSMDLKWLRFLMISGLVFYGLICGMYILDYIFSVFSYNALQNLGFSFAAVFILFLGFYGHRQGSIFASTPIILNLEKTSDILSEPSLNEEDRVFVTTLLNYMNDQKPFLNSEITIAHLSNELKVNTEYLSSILNGQLNKNFFDFINHFRVEEFKLRCRQPEYKNITLIGIAFDCGFNSKATFNRVFKNTTGMTPGEFARQA